MTDDHASLTLAVLARRAACLWWAAPLLTLMVGAAVWPPQLVAVMVSSGRAGVVPTIALFVVVMMVLWPLLAVLQQRIRLADGAAAAVATPLVVLGVLMAMEAHPAITAFLVVGAAAVAGRAALVVIDAAHRGGPSSPPAHGALS